MTREGSRPLYDSLAIQALACTPNLLLVVGSYGTTSATHSHPVVRLHAAILDGSPTCVVADLFLLELIMEKETEQKNENINGFYKLLSSMKAVSPIYEKIMKHLVKSNEPVERIENMVENIKKCLAPLMAPSIFYYAFIQFCSHLKMRLSETTDELAQCFA